MLLKAKFTALMIICTVASMAASEKQTPIDSSLAKYMVAEGISGSLKSVGSDTMNNEMAMWTEGFRQFYPNVTCEIEGKGSGTAPPALIKGTADFGAMSREMKNQELDEFKSAFGYPPTAVRTSIDCIGVFVHKDNPITGMTMQQIDAVFSKTRRGGLSSNVKTWGDLGLAGKWADKPISLYGRNSASGTYGFFKEKALFKGDYKDSVKEQPGSSAVIQAVGSDMYGIGYSGIGYKTADVRVVPLALDTTEEFVEANLEKRL